MSRPGMRWLALVLLSCYVPQVTGCTSVHQVPVAEVPMPATDAIVGATLMDGTQVTFNGGAMIARDTLFGFAPKADGADTVQVVSHAFPMERVQRLWLRQGDTGKTVGLTIGIVVGVAALTAAVGAVAVSASSCPFVYVWDGTHYVLDAEPYGGATSLGMARYDLTPLQQLVADRGEYRLRFINEAEETQHTDLAELWAVDHAPGVRVLPDVLGDLHTVGALESPRAARDATGADLLTWFAAGDLSIWETMPAPDPEAAQRDTLVFTFARPGGATSGKFVVSLATGSWGGQMVRALLQLRGRALDDWYAMVDGNAAIADGVHHWNLREDLYALHVEVLERDGWASLGILGGGSPFVLEERVASLDLGEVVGDSLVIRLRPPKGFWAIGSVGMDFTADQPVRVTHLAAVHALDERQGDMLAMLARVDSSYWTMPLVGDRGEVTFDAPPVPADRERSLLLHTNGWYRLHLDPDGEPDTAMMRAIAEDPGAVLMFSAQTFARYQLARTASR